MVLIVSVVFISYIIGTRSSDIGSSKNLSSSLSMSEPEMAFIEEDMARAGEFADLEFDESFSPDIPPADRLQTFQITLSLLVNNVEEATTSIISQAEELGGFIISSNIQDRGELPTGSITARVPTSNQEDFLVFAKEQGIKTVSENKLGTDITDEYYDVTSRLDILRENKARFENIMDQASDVQDILDLQRELFLLQDQIDWLTGRQQALEQQAQYSLVTMYLSSDETALPFVPDNAWRPQVIVTNAVRSLILFFQTVGTVLIWIGVFSVIWIPLVAGVYYWSRQKKRPNSNKNQ